MEVNPNLAEDFVDRASGHFDLLLSVAPHPDAVLVGQHHFADGCVEPVFGGRSAVSNSG